MFIESPSPTEVMIRATGFGRKDVDAIEDAKKCAVNFVIQGSYEPILKTPEEKEAFSKIAVQFFRGEYAKYITWESNQVLSRVRTADGQIKVEKMFRINREALMQYLVDNGITKSRQDITETVGLPVIMVIPEPIPGKNPVEMLQTNKLYRFSATVIESYLSSRGYDVVVPDQVAALNEMKAVLGDIRGSGMDDAYLLALSVGSDVYITFQPSVSERSVAGRTVRKASVSVKAYETTTASLLGAETGYSEERPVERQLVVEEAMHNAVEGVLSRMLSYWKGEVAKGTKYKLVFNVVGSFSEDDLEEIAFAINDALDEVANQKKKVTITEKTMEYLVWSKKYRDSMDLYRALRKAFKASYEGDTPAKLKKVFDSRKLLVFEVKRSE